MVVLYFSVFYTDHQLMRMLTFWDLLALPSIFQHFIHILDPLTDLLFWNESAKKIKKSLFPATAESARAISADNGRVISCLCIEKPAFVYLVKSNTHFFLKIQ